MGRPRSPERPALRRADCHRRHRKRRHALRGPQSAGERHQHHGLSDHARHPHRLSIFRCGLGPQSDGPILRGTQPPLGARSIDGDFRERFRPRGAQARFRVPGIPMTDAAAYSLVAGISVGFAAGYVGSLMVLKRMALVGDALSHVALPGLALGILFNFNPFFGAFAFLFSAAVLTWYIEKTTRLFPESIIGVLFVTALAVGILLTPEVDLLEALFGDITTVSLMDALLAVGISVPIVLVSRLIYRRVVLSILSEELARSTGVNVALVNFVYLFLVTVVVAVGIKIVGTVLVGALVIVPAAAMKNVSRSLSSYALLSGLTGIASAGSGILLADYLHLPAGPLVVTVGTAIFVGALVAGWIASRR